MAGGPPLILVGMFGAAHGLRGEVRLKSYTADPAAIGTYGPLQDAAGARVFTIKTLRGVGKDMFVARLAEIADRDTAEALNGTELFIARSKLPPAKDEDEFYQADLIGLRVENENGEVLGRIVALHDFGAGDILEIAPPPEAASKATAMLAFTRALVPVVDITGGRIVVAIDPFAE
ncbi:MAG: ribosome maturation factor RimM [Beijerinckiaceae bacterium]